MPKLRDPLRSRGKALEEMFFHRQDNVLIETKRQLEKTERTLKSVSDISGIKNESVLRRLIELNVQIEVLATLSLIPLVEVAWADGKVTEKERKAVLDSAEGLGLGKGRIDTTLLDQWLQSRPPKGLLESWIYYIQGLCELLTEAERKALKAEILERALAVAGSTGGFMGLTSKVSLREHDVLAQIESAFGV
jgi:hypothetical protein